MRADVSYVESKIDFLVDWARKHCGHKGGEPWLEHEIARDILDLASGLIHRRYPHLLSHLGPLLSVFPLLKKDADGLFKKRLEGMEGVLLSIQVKIARSGKRKG